MRDKELEKRMAQMCIESPGYLNWEDDKLREHVEWIMSVETQVHEDITFKTKGYV
jgi:hypothetical protein